METGPASVDSVDFCKEVVEGLHIIKFVVEWNGGWVREEILDDSSAELFSSLLEALNTSAPHMAIHFRS